MKETDETRRMVAELLGGQRFAVLSTESEGSPYANLIAFWAPDDLTFVVFATMRATRKFNYLVENPRVALLFDNRSNRDIDVREAMAVTATGTAGELPPAHKSDILARFLAKHPHLESFVSSPGCALVRIDIDTFYVVTRFQNVVELHMHPQTEAAAAGRTADPGCTPVANESPSDPGAPASHG